LSIIYVVVYILSTSVDEKKIFITTTINRDEAIKSRTEQRHRLSIGSQRVGRKTLVLAIVCSV